jgi:NAD(P)-dependent dehydrogenase (short-subunit alcohol dehydrogenase family)
MIPLGKLGMADDVANTILFLASPLAGQITASTFGRWRHEQYLMPATGGGTGQKASS